MNKKLLLILLFGLFVNGVSFAQEESGEDSETPWLTGDSGKLPIKQAISAPLFDMTIGDESGANLPEEVTEDEPLTVSANSNIFFDDPPVKSITGEEYYQAQWLEDKALALWHVNDWERQQSFLAPIVQENLPANQMVIIPTTPTDDGSVTCHSSRKMQYISEEGKTITCFANSSSASMFKVKDITPPVCGLEISIVNGQSGSLWPVENPPNQYPLPKTADMCFSGELFNASEEDRIVQGYELGNSMIVSNEDGGIRLSKDSVIKVKVIGDDNFKLDTDKIKYGVCAGAGGEPTPVSPVNESEIDFSKFLIPENPYLYLDASDVAGNREIIFIPLDIQ
jgi:hypothetical protein